MEFCTIFVVPLFLLACVSGQAFDGEYTKEKYCPMSVKHGDWKIDYVNGYRCILRCDEGFEPSECHVISEEMNRVTGMGIYQHVLNGPATAAGSWFAASTSAGAAGVATSTQVGIFSTASSVTKYATELISGCENE